MSEILNKLREISFFRSLNSKDLRFIFGSSAAVLLFVLLGFFFEALYHHTAERPVDFAAFESTLHKKERLAMEALQNVKKEVDKSGVGYLYRSQKLYKDSESNEMCLLVIRNDEILFWSNNSIDLSFGLDTLTQSSFFVETANCYVEGLQLRGDGEYRYVALLRIKAKVHPDEDDVLNRFAEGFSLPSKVSIVGKDSENAFAVRSYSGQYLFSLEKETEYSPVELMYWLCFASWGLAFVCLMFLFQRVFSMFENSKFAWLKFSVAPIPFIVLMSVLLYFRVPGIVFECEFFSPMYYASSVAPSVGHLFFYTVLLWGYLLILGKLDLRVVPMERFAKGRKLALVMLVQLLMSLAFFFAYQMTVNFVYNSSMDVAITLMQDITVFTVCSILLILGWFVLFVYFCYIVSDLYAQRCSLRVIFLAKLIVLVLSLIVWLAFDRDPDYFAFLYFVVISVVIDIAKYYDKQRSFFMVSVIAFLLINMVISISYFHCDIRNTAKYQRVADNLASGNIINKDVVAEKFMDRLSIKIKADILLRRMVCDSLDRTAAVDSFLQEKYFNGFWKKYDMMAQVVKKDAPFSVNKSRFGKTMLLSPKFVKDKCVRVNSTNFFVCTDETMSLNYLGVFEYQDKVLYVKLYPDMSSNRNNYDFLGSNGKKMGRMNISVVKYHNNEMLYISGKYHYPNVSTWIPKVRHDNFQFYSSGYVHYVARFGTDGIVVVSKPEHQSYSYLIFVSYLFAVYLIVGFVILGLGRMWSKEGRCWSLLSRMQLWFLIPMMLSIVALGGLTISFFLNQFKKKQIDELSFRAASIQQNIQNKLDIRENLDEVSANEMHKWAEELSSLFQTDIVFYDENGGQVASSRAMYVLERRKYRRLMSPQAMFSMQTEYYQDEKRNGVEFLSYYTRLYNKRNQHLGYLNVLSSSGAVQIKNEIFNILVVIIDVYLVVILLSILLIWIVNKSMMNPITTLAKKFTEFKLTGENSKVEYAYEDEIGQLVSQYNLMVDQLKDSAEKLAQSERESAWRDMARRIAHEIKNPLTPMKLSVQQSIRKKEIDPDNFDEYFKKTSKILIEQIDNLSRIASEFSSFAKASVMVKEDVDIAEKLQSVVTLFENNSEGVKFSLNMNGHDSAVILGDNKQILQVFNNLFKNAIQAIPEGKDGLVDVNFNIEQDRVLIRIKDNGCGIPNEIRDNLFQPNFTTKTSGMGLGLAIVKNILKSSDGDIWFESEEGVGTTFIIDVPLKKIKGEKL